MLEAAPIKLGQIDGIVEARDCDILGPMAAATGPSSTVNLTMANQYEPADVKVLQL